MLEVNGASRLLEAWQTIHAKIELCNTTIEFATQVDLGRDARELGQKFLLNPSEVSRVVDSQHAHKAVVA
jgi:hypothetical protein